MTHTAAKSTLDMGQIRLSLQELEEQGWSMFPGPTGEALATHLLALADAFSMEPVRQRERAVQRLTVREKAAAHPRSLSAQYGAGSFPFHIDTAHLTVPCRYVLLGAPIHDLSTRPTELLDFAQLPLTTDERLSLSQGLFLVTAGRRSFYATATPPTTPFIRFDPGCMRPLDDHARRTVALMSPERWARVATRVHWAAGTVLVLDNWRMLHRRATSNNDAGDRVLFRVVAR